MKCSACNGNLKYDNGSYICENCGNSYQFLSYFENDDVFIAYVENDDLGRRTKDSVIAQDIYQKLRVLGVNVFYARISAANLVGEDYTNATQISIANAKIILVVGSSAENFQKIISEYENFFNNKEIIPIYSQMNAYDLPDKISNIQSINYDAVGAIADVSKNILKKSGKSQDFDVVAKQEKSTKVKIKRYFLIGIGMIILIISMYIVFGTHYVLDSKKYDYAKKLEENGSYINALEIYFDIADYKDASNRINTIYDKYNGYFNKNNDEITLYLNIDKNINSKIKIIRSRDGEISNIQTESEVENHSIAFDFKDDNDNRGKGYIELTNTGIKLKINMDETTNDEIIREYEFSDRQDAPAEKNISANDLMDWLDNLFTLQDIHKAGIETKFIKDLSLDGDENVYSITNTNYGILVNGKNDAKIVGIYVPFEDIFPDNDFSYLPLYSGNYIYIHYKTHINTIANLSYELSGQITDFPDSTYFVTSKYAMNEYWGDMYSSEDKDRFWKDLQKSITEFCEYNQKGGIK